MGLVGNARYYNYTLSVDGRARQHKDDYGQDYLTDVIVSIDCVLAVPSFSEIQTTRGSAAEGSLVEFLDKRITLPSYGRYRLEQQSIGRVHLGQTRRPANLIGDSVPIT